MNIKILGIGCSPRDNSNSNAILEHSFSTLEKNKNDVECEIINLRDYKIEHCNACGVCGKSKDTGKFIPCILEDKDDVQKILNKMVHADGFAIATPVYFGMPSDLFCKFIMRTRLLRHQDFKLSNKTIGVMAIAGRRSGGAETTIMQTWLPFIRNGCLIVGNGNKTSQYGSMAWAGPRGHIKSDEWGLEQADLTAERIYEIAKLIKAGTKSVGSQNNMEFCYKSGGRH